MLENLFYTNICNINYVTFGNKNKSILLLHGGSSRWQTFEEIIPELAKWYTVYAIDLRGHGKSSRTPNRYRIQDYVPDVAEFIQQIIGKPTNIFGHSLGGMIALLTAAYYPSLVSTLIIGDSPLSLNVLKKHSDTQQEMTKLWREWATLLSREEIVLKLKAMQIPTEAGPAKTAAELYGQNHSWFDFMATNLKENDPDMLSSIIDRFDETYSKYEIETLFPKIECPVCILKGEQARGSLIRDEDIAIAKRLCRDICVATIHGSGHALYMDKPTETLHEIIGFMNNH